MLTLSQTALHKRSEKLELEEAQKIIITPPFISRLQMLLLDVYSALHPIPSDYAHRNQLVQMFDKMAKEIYGSSCESGFPSVQAFGSFMMDMFTTKSDLDLSVNFSNHETPYARHMKISALRMFARVLHAYQRKGRVSGVVSILRARVPIVKLVDCRTGIECDISVENKDGIMKSSIIAIISSIDERFQKLCFLMKAWAKTNGINSSKDHTLNSISIIMLVAFHLQTRDSPILPPLCTLLKDGTDATSLLNVVSGFKHFGRRNKENLAELFVALLIKLAAVETLWQHGLCASTYEGSWISKTWDTGEGNMSVEDFLDRSENCARSVGKAQVLKIYDCIRDSLSHLSNFMRGQMESAKLMTSLFGPVSLHKQTGQQVIDNQVGNHKRRFPVNDSASTPLEPITSKRLRYTGVGGGGPSDTISNCVPNPPVLHRPFVPMQHNPPHHRPFVPMQHNQPPHRPFVPMQLNQPKSSHVPSHFGIGFHHHSQPPVFPPDQGYGHHQHASAPPKFDYGREPHHPQPQFVIHGTDYLHQPPFHHPRPYIGSDQRYGLNQLFPHAFG